ncbi:MAG: TIGR00269 family protein [Candidatus Njordarchaeales archaeon]
MPCEPIYFKRDAKRFFCKDEFIKYFEKKVMKTINKWRMLRRDSKIAVAVSGGKDSMTLLHVLYKIEQRFPSQLVIVHLDEGIAGYSDIAGKLVKKTAEELNIPLYSASYKGLFNFTIDEIGHMYKKKKMLAPCTFCGVWRRWGLNYLALKAEADRLATAHCLDDEAQTILMNVLRGAFKNLLKLQLYPKEAPNIVPRIKPFREIPEKEVVLYATLKNIPYVDIPCPYARFGQRWDIRTWLYEQEMQYPGTLYNILSFHRQLLESLKNIKIQEEVKKCKICGYPSSSDICKAHQLKQYLLESKED